MSNEIPTTENRFYTIINLDKYKEKFADGKHKNDNESTIDIQTIYSTNTDAEKEFDINDQTTLDQINNMDHVKSLVNENKGFYNIKKGVGPGSSPVYHEFQIEGRPFEHYFNTNDYGGFQDAQKQWVTQNLKINNKIGFGYYQQGSYKEFGDMIVPGPNSNIKNTSCSVFFCGLKGAQGGGGGGGGANETWREKGGAGGASGDTRGAWIYPSSSFSKTIEFVSSTIGEGGSGGGGGNWGWQKGYGGEGGKPGEDTFIKYDVKDNDQNVQTRKFIITGSGGGGGGEGAERGGGAGGTGGQSSIGFTNEYVASVDGYEYVYNTYPGQPGRERVNGGRNRGRRGYDGENGKFSQFIYLSGSKANHNS